MKKGLFYLVRALVLLALVLGAVGCAKPAPTPAPATPAPTPAPAVATPAPTPPPVAVRTPTPAPVVATPAPTPVPATPTPVARPTPTPAPVVLKAVGHVALTNPTLYGTKLLIDKVNERAKGRLTIQWLGGPEVFPALQQAETLKKGVVDMVANPASYYNPIMPEGYAVPLSLLTNAEERKVGWYDYLRRVHKEKLNAYFLGGGNKGLQYSFIIKKKMISKPEDLTGLKIYGVGVYDPFLKALGAVSVSMTLADVYTSLERGLLDGAGMAPAAVIPLRWQEVSKYFINHPLWNGNVMIFINWDKWNALPEDMKKLLEDVQLENEPLIEAWQKEQLQKGLRDLVAAGLQPITFSPADASYYAKLAYAVYWELLSKTLPPDVYVTVRSMLTK